MGGVNDVVSRALPDGACLCPLLVKDRPLGIRPLYVRRDDQIVGLAHLLTLALRVLTLFEVLVPLRMK